MSAGPTTRWGFHRIADSHACRLVRDAGIRPGDLVLDIGAGEGAITAPLVAAGARVIAIELHAHRAQLLRARFADDDVVVVRCDASDLRLPTRPFRVVANPPFAVTTALLRRLLHRHSRLVTADLVLPRAAVVRWASGRGFGAPRFDLRMGRPLPRSALIPAPPNEVAVLHVRSQLGR